MGERWKQLIADGKWELREDFFWAQPRPLWEMPTRIRKVRPPGNELVVEVLVSPDCLLLLLLLFPVVVPVLFVF